MSGLPLSIWRCTFSISTVASSTRIPIASASPPRVIRLIVSPNALRMAMEESTASGMDVAMMIVLRQEPIKSRIIRAVRPAAMTPSLRTPLIAVRTNTDSFENS